MKLFKSTSGRNQVTVLIDLNQSELESKLWDWLEYKHNDIFMDIELFDGGSITVQENEITFNGDNGIFTLERSELETV